MSKKYSPVIILLVLAVLSIPILALAESYTISTASDKFRGTYLVNQSGFTLYYFLDDSSANGESTCYGECEELYPPFYVQNVVLSGNLRTIDFGETTRVDGNKQTTYKGWPLYYYSNDEESESFNGVGGAWRIVDIDNMPQVI